MNKISFFLGSLIFGLASLSCQSSEKKSEDWPAEYERFLSELTFPSKIWSESLGNQPNASDLVILEKNKPQIFVGPRGLIPIDFYRDYVAHAQLKDASGNVVVANVSPESLKKYERTFGYYLDHDESVPDCQEGTCENAKAPVYGRVYREKILLDQTDQARQRKQHEREVFILKYNLVFQASGLPENLGNITNVLARTAGDPNLWHELDIHGAIHIIVDSITEKPLALLLAQHNHFRTYVFGKDISRPNNQGIKICYSQRSNEPYLCDLVTKDHPTSGDPHDFPLLISGKNPGLFSGKDRVYGLSEGAVAIETKLQTLPDHDPFYVSWISLGEQKKLFGFIPIFYRNGPPGADINTFPQLKNYLDTATFYYLDPNDDQALEIYRNSNLDFVSADVTQVLSHNRTRFVRAIQESLAN